MLINYLVIQGKTQKFGAGNFLMQWMHNQCHMKRFTNLRSHCNCGTGYLYKYISIHFQFLMHLISYPDIPYNPQQLSSHGGYLSTLFQIIQFNFDGLRNKLLEVSNFIRDNKIHKKLSEIQCHTTWRDRDHGWRYCISHPVRSQIHPDISICTPYQEILKLVDVSTSRDNDKSRNNYKKVNYCFRYVD